MLVDDNSSSVSLPEVPLLGVLPGTGGLTRVVDKRGVRRDLADVFSTTAEGIRGDRAVQWRLVDGIAKARDFADEIARRAAEAAATSSRPGAGAQGVALTRCNRAVDGDTHQLRARPRRPRPRRRHRDDHRARPDRGARRASRSCTSRATGPGCSP